MKILSVALLAIILFGNSQNELPITNYKVTCSGNACAKVKHRFTDKNSRFDFKYEVKNTSDKSIKVTVNWIDFYGISNRSTNHVVWEGESYKFTPPQPNKSLISVKSIKAVYE